MLHLKERANDVNESTESGQKTIKDGAVERRLSSLKEIWQ